MHSFLADSVSVETALRNIAFWNEARTTIWLKIKNQYLWGYKNYNLWFDFHNYSQAGYKIFHYFLISLRQQLSKIKLMK